MIVGGSGVSIYPEIFPICTEVAFPYTLTPGIVDTTKLFPQPSKVLRLMMKMTTAGKVLLLMNPLQWESPCLPFRARSVSE